MTGYLNTRKSLFVLVMAIATMITVLSMWAATASATPVVVYTEDFEGAAPDLSKWSSAGGGPGCTGLPDHAAMTAALKASVAPTGGPANGGFDLHMWATVVNRDGQVCAVTFSGGDRGEQWPGSRVISAQKANTANAFSLPDTAPIAGLSLSTANLWAATQPGGSLFGLQFSNPVDTAVAYGGPSSQNQGKAKDYGTKNDPLVGRFVG